MTELQGWETKPACPMCNGETDVKQVHREPRGELIVYKCRTCHVEYPVVAGLRPDASA